MSEPIKLRAERDALRAAFHEAQARELAAVQELDEARAECDALRAENETLRAECEALCGEKDELFFENDELCAENDALRAECDALAKALQVAIRRNEHDMLMTGEQLRAARAALKEAK